MSKALLLHEYKDDEILMNRPFNTRKELADYLHSRGCHFRNKVISDIGSDLVTIYSPDGTKFEIEELVENRRDEVVRINGKVFVSIDKYCRDTGKNRRDIYRSYHLERRK